MSGNEAEAQKSAQERIRTVLYVILNPIVGVVLLWLAVLEALAVPFFGMKFALGAIATAACAVGLLVALLGLGIDYLGIQVGRVLQQDKEAEEFGNTPWASRRTPKVH